MMSGGQNDMRTDMSIDISMSSPPIRTGTSAMAVASSPAKVRRRRGCGHKNLRACRPRWERRKRRGRRRQRRQRRRRKSPRWTVDARRPATVGFAGEITIGDEGFGNSTPAPPWRWPRHRDCRLGRRLRSCHGRRRRRLGGGNSIVHGFRVVGRSRSILLRGFFSGSPSRALSDCKGSMAATVSVRAAASSSSVDCAVEARRGHRGGVPDPRTLRRC